MDEIKRGSRWMQKEDNRVILRVIIGDDENPYQSVIPVREENGDFWFSYIGRKSLLAYYDKIEEA